MSDGIKTTEGGGVSDNRDAFARISEKIMPLSFYKAGGVHTGNLDSMRYIIKKESAGNPDSGERTDSLFVSAWPGPFTFENTKDELKVCTSLPLDEGGLAKAARWLADAYEASEENSKPLSLLECNDRLKEGAD